MIMAKESSDSEQLIESRRRHPLEIAIALGSVAAFCPRVDVSLEVWSGSAESRSALVYGAPRVRDRRDISTHRGT